MISIPPRVDVQISSSVLPVHLLGRSKVCGSFCLLKAKVFGLEGRGIFLADLLLSSWEVKTMRGENLCQFHSPLEAVKREGLGPF